MIVLALDVGAKRIGVAVSDEMGLLASPRGIIRRQSTAQALSAIERAVSESGAALVVVGLPISFDGQLHAQARTIQAFAEQLRKRLQVPLVYADEALSSVRAEEQLRAAGMRPQRIRERLDAAAAAVILQDYLDQRRDAQRKAATLSPGSAGVEPSVEPGDEPSVEPGDEPSVEPGDESDAEREADARSHDDMRDAAQGQARDALNAQVDTAPGADTLDGTEEMRLP